MRGLAFAHDVAENRSRVVRFEDRATMVDDHCEKERTAGNDRTFPVWHVLRIQTRLAGGNRPYFTARVDDLPLR